MSLPIALFIRLRTFFDNYDIKTKQGDTFEDYPVLIKSMSVVTNIDKHYFK